MALNANIHTDSMGNILVLMKGGLNYENTHHLELELKSLVHEHPTSQITIDLNQVDFVGSSGIGLFVDIIQSINNKSDQIRLSNVKTEFLKVFKLYAKDAMDALMLGFDDDETEFLSQNYANRRKTFQN